MMYALPGFVVVIPVGPSAAESERTLDLLDALRSHEPRARRVLLVDDAPQPREWPHDVSVIANPRFGRGIGTLGGTCAATLAALKWAHDRHPGWWVLRLDTDALVIGPVADRVEEAFARHPRAGILGSCHTTCNGEPRDIDLWDQMVRKHTRSWWLWRRPPRRGRFVMKAVPRVRDTVLAAMAAGYRPGEHCIAAGCAIRGELVTALERGGKLERPERWLRTFFGDDIMLGAMARAAGYELHDLHEVFGLKHVGLADEPERLLERGFGVIHSVKNDPDRPEDEIRAFFRARREATS